MSNPNPQHKFKKGENNNPRGGGAHDKKMKALKKITGADVEELITLILNGTMEELQRIAANPAGISPMKAWFASVAITGINRGDVGPIMILLERVIGKVTEKSQITIVNPSESMSDEELAAVVSSADEKLKKLE